MRNELRRLAGARSHGPESFSDDSMCLNQNMLESERGRIINYTGHGDNRYKLGTISGKAGYLFALHKDQDFTLKYSEKLLVGIKLDCRKFEIISSKGFPSLFSIREIKGGNGTHRHRL